MEAPRIANSDPLGERASAAGYSWSAEGVQEVFRDIESIGRAVSRVADSDRADAGV